MSDNGSSFSVIPVNGFPPSGQLQPEMEKFSTEIYLLLKPHLEAGDRVVKVASCRRYYSVVLLESGNLLLCCPDAPSYHGSVVESGGEFVVDVAAGESHFVFCTESGAVYSFGYSNRYGQMGDGSLWQVDSLALLPPLLSEPKRIPGFGEVYDDVQLNNDDDREETLMDAGNPEDDEGSNDSRERKEMTGDDTKVKKRFVKGDISYDITLKETYPQRDPVRICAVACGLHHTLLMSAKRNSVYACGRGHCGQLSGKRNIPVLATFRVIRLLFGLPIRSIAAAGHHSFVLLSTGKLLAFGENSCGQLGVGHCSKVSAPTAGSFLPENCAFAAGFKEGGVSAASKRLYDAKMYSTLRAAYSSYESTYFPMRVERIDAELAPHEPFVIEVWTCETATIILTSELKWMSCGLPLSRFTGCRQNSSSRFDGFGALGRPLLSKEEAYSFGYMHFSCAVRDKIKESGYVFEGLSDNSVQFQRPAEKRLECFCFPHTTIVKIPGQSQAAADAADDITPRSKEAVIFIQSNVVNSFVEMSADDSQEDIDSEVIPSYRAHALKRPVTQAGNGNFVLRGNREGHANELDDDSCSFCVGASSTVLPFSSSCILV